MLNKHLIAETRPQASPANIVHWRDYRITVLQDRLFRIEKCANRRFRDAATLSVFYRDMPPQIFRAYAEGDKYVVETNACKLLLAEKRRDVRIVLDGEILPVTNKGNLLGTCRTLDRCDGDLLYSDDGPRRVRLESGVCSRTGVALFHDEGSNTLLPDGTVSAERGRGTDEYVFAYGSDYRAAVRALYLITGSVPMLPRYALGNWWSRYYDYSAGEYLRLMRDFRRRGIPFTVATVDMDWHYSDEKEMISVFGLPEDAAKDPRFKGAAGWGIGWTGYSWNKRLFPDHKEFLSELHEMGLAVTLNLHPSDGFRPYEDCYRAVAEALGRDPEKGERIPFNASDPAFLNAYFDVVHHPFEKEGVTFWWIDWQQGTHSAIDGLDPLWSLNHYHYLDNAAGHDVPLILSRYAGIGSHRYPLGFSGDTHITWRTLRYLPYFTATASNVGYCWWSHDIGGHMHGKTERELFLRHIQYGVFSPVCRLHGTKLFTTTKDPAVYGGEGLVAVEYLRLRHRMIPYLYTLAYRTHTEGIPLVEPLYFRHGEDEAYRHPAEYYFGDLLVAPAVTPKRKDGYARVKTWFPAGRWTDLFTQDVYEAPEGGRCVELLRRPEEFPVFAPAGAIIPLSSDGGNSSAPPRSLTLWAYRGDGAFVLHEDEGGATKTSFAMCDHDGTLTLTVRSEGESDAPPVRKLTVLFRDIPVACATTETNGVREEDLRECASAEFEFERGKTYTVKVHYRLPGKDEAFAARASRILVGAEEDNDTKEILFREIVSHPADALDLIAKAKVSSAVKHRLTETLL